MTSRMVRCRSVSAESTACMRRPRPVGVSLLLLIAFECSPIPPDTQTFVRRVSRCVVLGRAATSGFVSGMAYRFNRSATIRSHVRKSNALSNTVEHAIDYRPDGRHYDAHTDNKAARGASWPARLQAFPAR